MARKTKLDDLIQRWGLKEKWEREDRAKRQALKEKYGDDLDDYLYDLKKSREEMLENRKLISKG